MNNPNFKQIETITIDIAKAAGEVLRCGYTSHKKLHFKSTETDLVTEFDTKTEALILERLRDHFPEHGIVAEESGRCDKPDCSLTWYIDPLDGTNNFAHGLGHFCVSMGLYQNDQPVVGVIYDPLRDECFCATIGEGARMIDPQGQSHPLTVSKNNCLIQSMIVTGFPYDKHISDENNLPQFCAMTTRVRGIRRMGSAALDLAYVAAGRMDGYWEFKLNPWDIAAGWLLVTEAGGVVTDVNKQPLQINQSKIALIASNGLIHDEMFSVLDSCG